MNVFKQDTPTAEIYCQDVINNAKGIKNLRKFFHNLLKNFDTESFNFYKIWGEFPFIYSEKQLASVLAPAIYSHTKNVWFEQPFKDYKKNQRFLDIAIADQKNIYLIELKHSWNSKRNETNKKSSQKWETAIDQIKTINRKTIYSYFNFQDYNVFKIALMIMPTYLNYDEDHNILKMSAKEYATTIFDEYESYTTKQHKANLTAVIKLTNPKQYKHDFTIGSQIYPYISFIARIEIV